MELNQMKNMTNKINIKNFPPDVATLICSFGYPEYKEYMNEISYQITHFTGKGLFEYNLYLFEEDYLYLSRINYIRTTLEFLTYAVDDEVLENLFIQCTKCCCCSKHCHNRPTKYYTNEVSIGENFNTDETCHCKCRSLSRNIKRVQSERLQSQLELGTELSECKKYKKRKKCRRKSTFNIQFIPYELNSSRSKPSFTSLSFIE